jgi:hypothetical protein
VWPRSDRDFNRLVSSDPSVLSGERRNPARPFFCLLLSCPLSHAATPPHACVIVGGSSDSQSRVQLLPPARLRCLRAQGAVNSQGLFALASPDSGLNCNHRQLIPIIDSVRRLFTQLTHEQDNVIGSPGGLGIEYAVVGVLLSYSGRVQVDRRWLTIYLESSSFGA